MSAPRGVSRPQDNRRYAPYHHTATQNHNAANKSHRVRHSGPAITKVIPQSVKNIPQTLAHRPKYFRNLNMKELKECLTEFGLPINGSAEALFGRLLREQPKFWTPTRGFYARQSNQEIMRFVIDRKIRSANIAQGLEKNALMKLLIKADRKGIEAVQGEKPKTSFFDLGTGKSLSSLTPNFMHIDPTLCI
jgi:hypothetical protein